MFMTVAMVSDIKVITQTACYIGLLLLIIHKSVTHYFRYILVFSISRFNLIGITPFSEILLSRDIVPGLI